MSTQGTTTFLTLYKREVFRFLKVYNQTLLAPTVTALLFLAIFSLALKDRTPNVGEISFYHFIIPGLIMMTMVQNAFANTSSSFIMGKVLGTLIDYLLPPISTFHMTSAMILGGITRGVCSGLCVAIAISLFHPLFLHDFILLIAYVLLASCLLATLGILAGIIAESFRPDGSHHKLYHHAFVFFIWHILFYEKFARVLAGCKPLQPFLLHD